MHSNKDLCQCFQQGKGKSKVPSPNIVNIKMSKLENSDGNDKFLKSRRAGQSRVVPPATAGKGKFCHWAGWGGHWTLTMWKYSFVASNCPDHHPAGAGAGVAVTFSWQLAAAGLQLVSPHSPLPRHGDWTGSCRLVTTAAHWEKGFRFEGTTISEPWSILPEQCLPWFVRYTVLSTWFVSLTC